MKLLAEPGAIEIVADKLPETITATVAGVGAVFCWLKWRGEQKAKQELRDYQHRQQEKTRADTILDGRIANLEGDLRQLREENQQLREIFNNLNSKYSQLQGEFEKVTGRYTISVEREELLQTELASRDRRTQELEGMLSDRDREVRELRERLEHCELCEHFQEKEE